MAKTAKKIFFCQNCGHESSKWMGQCPGCHEWNSFVEEPVKAASSSRAKKTDNNKPVRISEVSVDEDVRFSTKIGELDRVLGGGIVRGSLVLIGGDPGIGKSTLLLQTCYNLSAAGHNIMYVSGEESLRQIKMRAGRLGCAHENLLLYCETDLESISEQIERIKPDMVVIDSIQTMSSEAVQSAPGSVSQVRETCGILLRLAKSLGVAIFIVGHVTKEGAVAGPRVLEHMVDTVMYFEGENTVSYRILRAVKNRFGSTNEMGVFEMRNEGLVEVENPSEFMLSGNTEDESGSIVTCAIEGTRPLLLEIQALVGRTSFGYPRRTANGFDYNRLNLLLAVLEKRIGCDLSSFDAYVNIAGGIKINEPSADLAIVLAIISSFKDISLGKKIMAFGEVGLSGEVRGVSHADIRVREAMKMGFEKAIIPASNLKNISGIKGIEIISASNVKDVKKILSL